MFFTPSSFARLITASDSSGATCPVARDRFSRATIFSTSSVSGNTLPPAATLSPSRGSLRILCWLPAPKVGSHTTLPRPPDMRWNHSTALGFTPPTARLSAIPPQISMPGTARLTSAARSAVGATWFFSTMPRMPLRAAMRATSKSSRLRLNASGSLWTWMSIAPAAGLTLGGGGGKPVCANSTMENASADAPADAAAHVLNPFMISPFLSELHRPLDRGPRGHFIRPARDVRKALEQRRLRGLHARDHAVKSEVGDGHLAAGTVALFCQPAVPDLHAVVPHRLERVDRVQGVSEAAFFQPDARAHAVRGAGGVEVDHGWLREGRRKP